MKQPVEMSTPDTLKFACWISFWNVQYWISGAYAKIVKFWLVVMITFLASNLYRRASLPHQIHVSLRG